MGDVDDEVMKKERRIGNREADEDGKRVFTTHDEEEKEGKKDADRPVKKGV